MEIGSLASVVSAFLGFLATLWTVYRYISNSDDALRRDMSVQTDTLRREIAAANKEAVLLIDKMAESEAKQRHAMANQTQATLIKLETDLRTLQREAVRTEQMQAVENRLNGALGKIEVKVDRLSDSLAVIEAMKTQMQTILATMSRISDRLDEDNGIRRNTRPV